MKIYKDYRIGNSRNSYFLKYNHDGLIDGSQIHILSYLGRKWGVGNPRFTEEQIVEYSLDINEVGGAVTWDVPPVHYGTISSDFMKQLVKIG